MKDNEKKNTNNLGDLIASKKEAKEKMHTLSDDELDMVAGGASAGLCPDCGKPWNGRRCFRCKHGYGDKRDGLNEAMADIKGLMADVDGFAE